MTPHFTAGSAIRCSGDVRSRQKTPASRLILAWRWPYTAPMSQALFETDPATLADLIAQLRTLAHAARRRMAAGETLATTALVNEAYLKLTRPSSAKALDPRHFFALAALAMREILIDEARRRRTSHELPAKEGEAEQWLAPALDPTRMVALDQAMRGLAALQPRLAQVVTCRFFAGYTEEETAEILGVDVRTVQRDWQRARAWLQYQDGAGLPQGLDAAP